MNDCSLARFSDVPCFYRADGQPDRCHWIPKQRLIAEYSRRGYPFKVVTLAAMDSRVTTPGCRKHHDQLDGRNAITKLVLSEADYPLELHEYAREFSWYFAGPRDGWRVNRLALELAPAPAILADFEPVPGRNA